MGVVGAIASFVWEGFWLIGPPLGVSDRKWYLFWGLVALAISNFQAFFVLLKQNKQLTVALDEKRRIRQTKEAIGKLLEHVAQCESEAYKGSSSAEYDKLYQQVEQIKRRAGEIATEFLDTSFESRFLAVKVLDSNLDESIRKQFIQRSGSQSFWTVYQQLRGWRAFLVGILQELGH
jgi:hypothetical protein